MKPGIVEPVVVEESGPGGRKQRVTQHPAFGQIVASRVSGNGMVLYGSDFVHNGCVRVTIRTSEQMRDLSHDWYFAGRELITVELSEAQWATFVSAMNVDSGPPCTIVHVKGERMPGLPTPGSSTATFEADAAEDAAEAIAALDALAARIAELKVSEKQRKELLGHVETARRKLTESLPFVLEQFSRYAHKTVARAKVEVSAYVTRTLTRLGLDRLRAITGEDEVVRLHGHDDGGGQ